MLAIDVITSFKNLLKEEERDFSLPKQTILNILQSYEDDLGDDGFGEVSKAARIEHFYKGQSAYKAQLHETNLEVYKTINAAGQSAMRSIFLMNGGAAIAMSAFIGTLATSPNSKLGVTDLVYPLTFFAFGTFSASIAYGLTYLTGFAAGYADEKEKWRYVLGSSFNFAAIFAGIGSFLCFGFGLYNAYIGMINS